MGHAVPLLALCMLLASPGAQAAQPADPARVEAQLRELREHVRSLEASLAADRRRESRLSQELAEAEKAVQAVDRRLRALQGELAEVRERLAALRDDHARARAELRQQQARIGHQLRAAWRLGRQERLRLLLNQQDPAAAGRVLVYYEYLTRARLARTEALEQQLAEIAALERDIRAEQERLQLLHGREQAEREALAERQAARERALARLRASLQAGDRELRSLQADRKRLEKLIESLRLALADVEAAQGDHPPFSKLKRKLPWPVAGRLVATFGQPRDIGGLKWRGAFISTPVGAEVHAVAHGRVAFADWLRGFGLLIIVDHGDGYMTLYGHNRALYKEVGDWVERGELIAASGDSGGSGRAGLYFEIRHRGQPVDPLKWCAGRPTALAASR